MTRNTLRIDFSPFEDMLTTLDDMGGDVVRVTDRALREAAVQVQNDTVLAVGKAHLPAHGEYSRGDTEKSIIHFPAVEWEGLIGSVPVGFDFSKPGAGGFLIAGRRASIFGTPRMEPDKKLHRMYKGKKYIKDIQNKMMQKVTDEIIRLSEES